MSHQTREFRPEADLGRTVDAFWMHARGTDRSDGSADDCREAAATLVPIIPDGCIDLIFRARPRPADGAIMEGELFVAGPNARVYTVAVEPGTCFVGVRLRPGMSRLLIDADPASLTRPEIAATQIDPAFAGLADRLCAAAGEPLRMMTILRAEVRRAAALNTRGRPPRSIRQAIAWLGQVDPATPVGAVARLLDRSPRSVHREVLAWTGLAPKTLARILRLQAALRRIRIEPDLSLGLIAHETGYADQAHMTRDFQRLAGSTPANWRLPLPENAVAAPSPICSRRGLPIGP